MKPADQVAAFVGKALAAGKSREETTAALQGAGWTEGEVARAMSAWAEGDFQPPVPRPRSLVSAQEAFTYGLMFTALAFSVFHINSLGFSLLDIWFLEPGEDDYSSNWIMQSIRWSIALLIVSVPVFLWLNRAQSRAVVADKSKRRSGLRKWFGYVTLFCAAVGLAGDLVSAIYALLNGDLTTEFALKCGLVLVTLLAVFVYAKSQTEDADAA